MSRDLVDEEPATGGLPAPGEAVGVVSPHMDDAALSCGSFLAARPGSHVVTLFSGGPSSVRPLPEWDLLSQVFSAGDDVMAIRAVEDDDAMAAVGAVGLRLDFWDEQYRAGPPVRHARYRPLAVRLRQARLDRPALLNEIDQKLARTVEQLPFRTWLVPLGLWHGDHFKTAAACLRLARRRPDLNWVVYEELPYRIEVPNQVAEGRARLQAAGFGFQEVLVPPPERPSLKRAMVASYRSQLPALGRRVDVALAQPEVFLVLGGLAP